MPFARLAAVAVLLATTLGCVRTYSVTPTGAYVEAIQAHYVIVQGGPSGKFKVFDCRASPDGEKYQPVCVQVDLRKNP
jgi:hypothetical protein